MRLCFSTLFLMLFAFSSYAQSEFQDHQVIILGNIADVTEHGIFIENLEVRLNAMDTPFTVFLNGDIANNGAPKGEDNLALAKQIMDLMDTKDLGNLKAPVEGSMDRRIAESIDAKLKITVLDNKKRIIFCESTSIAGLEIVGNIKTLKGSDVGEEVFDEH